MSTISNDDAHHFLDLVIQGQRQGCSSGEHAARELAICISKHAPTLDDRAVAGLLVFIAAARCCPGTVREAIGA